MYYLADYRMQSIGMKPFFNTTTNPFPWLSEIVELPRMSNFFEKKIHEYAVSNLNDDF
jgi:ribonucleoside-diphosphate reductase beta chain